MVVAGEMIAFRILRGSATTVVTTGGRGFLIPVSVRLFAVVDGQSWGLAQLARFTGGLTASV